MADTSPEQEEFSQDLYKHWFKFGERSGFLALRPWLETLKISVDIGDLTGGSLKQNTLVWANIVELSTYLTAVRNGTAAKLYPKNDKAGAPTDEGFVYYGGGSVNGKAVSRVLKIHLWETKDGSVDQDGFAWKTGHFEGTKSDTGAYIPNLSKPLSINMIKIPRQKMSEIAFRVELCLIGHAVRNVLWYQAQKKSDD